MGGTSRGHADRIYEWTFSSTAELAVGALLVITILSVAFI
jgi:hypothetical protein